MLTIQFGQCGNQLGYSLFQQLCADLNSRHVGLNEEANSMYIEESNRKWFSGIDKDGKQLARAILVDTENKVVNNILNKNVGSSWTYRSQNLICQSSGGSANNWAYGSLVKGPQLKDDILEITRKEIEKTDCFDGILLLLSSAGGTGSGVGSFTADLLRNEFPNKTIIGSIVLPFTTGEVGVQNYNTILTLARFSETVDLNIVFENEQIHKICTSILKNVGAELFDINDVISKKLCAVFQPVSDVWFNANHLTSLIACHPNYKLATIKSTPYISPKACQYETWNKWVVYVLNMKKTLQNPSFDFDWSNYKYFKSVSNVLVSRGSITDDDPMPCQYLRKQSMYVDWLDFRRAFTHFNTERSLLNKRKFLTLVTNNAQIHQTLDDIVNKAANTYAHSAFVHQYNKYGLENIDFEEAFAKVENIIQDYKNL